MSGNSLAEDYLGWLAPQIRDEDDGHLNREFWGLLDLMYEKDFVWLVANDVNRRTDGLDLRVDFCYAQNISMGARRREPLRSFLNKDQPNPACSFLEVLIALSKRLAFSEGKSASHWAWVLLTNLGLHRMADPLSRRDVEKASEIIDRCLWRAYEPDGNGGLFPLKSPREDQTEVELWYQMAAFIDELQ